MTDFILVGIVFDPDGFTAKSEKPSSLLFLYLSDAISTLIHVFMFVPQKILFFADLTVAHGVGLDLSFENSHAHRVICEYWKVLRGRSQSNLLCFSRSAVRLRNGLEGEAWLRGGGHSEVELRNEAP